MEHLKSFCNKIAFLCRVRYELFTFNTPDLGSIVIRLDESVLKVLNEIQRFFGLKQENIELFLIFFWDCLKGTKEWQESVEKFGKDFTETEDFLENLLMASI